MPRKLSRACVVIVAVLLGQTGTLAAFAQDFDFRSVRWGMTIEEVRAAEPSHFFESILKPSSDQMSLVYECMIGEQPCRLFYEFNNRGRVYASYYSFIEVPFEQIYDFDRRLRATLDEKYPKARENRRSDFWRTKTTDIELRSSKGHPGVYYASRTVPAVEDGAGEPLPKDQF